MKSPAYVLAVAVVVAFAAWAYRVNYDTQAGLARLEELRERIATERETISVLEVEWAYLNRPDRLEYLANRFAAELGLMPLDPAHYGELGLVAYPSADPFVAPPARGLAGRGEPMLPMTLPQALEVADGQGGRQ